MESFHELMLGSMTKLNHPKGTHIKNFHPADTKLFEKAILEFAATYPEATIRIKMSPIPGHHKDVVFNPHEKSLIWNPKQGKISDEDSKEWLDKFNVITTKYFS